MQISHTPLADPNAYSRHNLATGPLAEASLRAWAGLQAARAYRRIGDALAHELALAAIRARASDFPPEARRFVSRALADFSTAPTGAAR